MNPSRSFDPCWTSAGTRFDAALSAWEQPFRDDDSNRNSKFTRNFIRHEVLPLIRSRFPAPDASIARLSKQAVEQQVFLSELVGPLMEHVEFGSDQVVFDCRALVGTSVVMVRELVLRGTSSSGNGHLRH